MMKKKLFVIPAVIIGIAALLAGCGSKTPLTMDMAEDGSSCTITFDKATLDENTMTGTLTVGENDTVVVEQEMEGDGTGTVKFIPADGEALSDKDATLDELEGALDDENTALELVVSGSGSETYAIAAGDYYLAVTAENKATGTVNIRVEESTDPFVAGWNKVDSADAAAQAIGLESFKVPDGVTIGLGEVKADSFQYKEKVAMASIPFPAVQMYVMMGTDESGDVSGDPAEYANTWTQDINGVEVTCFGNREGDATKTIWTTDGVSYAVMAYGLGGDTDYGLSADDLNTVISAMQ